MVLAAASQVVVTGAIVACGVAGVAGCCKATGHDREYETIVGASTAAVTNVFASSRDFAGGVMEALSGEETERSTAIAADATAADGISAPVIGQPLYPAVSPPRAADSDMISLLDDRSGR